MHDIYESSAEGHRLAQHSLTCFFARSIDIDSGGSSTEDLEGRILKAIEHNAAHAKASQVDYSQYLADNFDLDATLGSS